MGRKIHMEFMQTCCEAVHKIVPCIALLPDFKWYAGSGFDDYVEWQRSVVLIPDSQGLPDRLFGIEIVIDETLAPNILELRDGNGNVVTLKIPEREV